MLTFSLNNGTRELKRLLDYVDRYGLKGSEYFINEEVKDEILNKEYFITENSEKYYNSKHFHYEEILTDESENAELKLDNYCYRNGSYDEYDSEAVEGLFNEELISKLKAFITICKERSKGGYNPFKELFNASDAELGNSNTNIHKRLVDHCVAILDEFFLYCGISERGIKDVDIFELCDALGKIDLPAWYKLCQAKNCKVATKEHFADVMQILYENELEKEFKKVDNKGKTFNEIIGEIIKVNKITSNSLTEDAIQLLLSDLGVLEFKQIQMDIVEKGIDEELVFTCHIKNKDRLRSLLGSVAID